MNAIGKQIGLLLAVLGIVAAGWGANHSLTFSTYFGDISEASAQTIANDQNAGDHAAALDETKDALESPVKTALSQRSPIAAPSPRSASGSIGNRTEVLKAEPKIDLRKGRIESPAKKVVLTNSSLVSPSDPKPSARKVDYAPKRKIEQPTEKLVAERSHHDPETNDVAGDTASDFDNPKVEPGKVRWHDDFAAACDASRKSGKPVLLFQMMGNLDDRFC